MLNFKKLIRLKSSESIFYIADQALYNLFSFVLIVVLVRTLPAESFGHFSYAYYLFPFLSIIQHGLIQMPLMNLSGKHEVDLTVFFAANLILSFCIGLGMSGFFFFGLFIVKFSLCHAFYFALFYLLFQNYEIIRRIIMIRGRKKSLLIADISRILLPFLLIFAAQDSGLVLSILILGFFVLNLIFFPFDVFQRFKSRQMLPYWRENWQFGRWVFANNIVQNISSNLFLYLGVVLLNTNELVSLNAPRVILGLGSILFLSMENIYTPKLQQIKDDICELFSKVLWIFRDYSVFFILFYSLIILLLFFQAPLAKLLFKISPESSTIWAYLFVLGLSALYRPILIVLRFQGLDKSLFRSSLLSLFIVVLCTYPMMSSFGINGALIMMLFLPVYNLIVGVLIINKENGKPITFAF